MRQSSEDFLFFFFCSSRTTTTREKPDAGVSPNREKKKGKHKSEIKKTIKQRKQSKKKKRALKQAAGESEPACTVATPKGKQKKEKEKKRLITGTVKHTFRNKDVVVRVPTTNNSCTAQSDTQLSKTQQETAEVYK